jgi:hypothetical protein
MLGEKDAGSWRPGYHDTAWRSVPNARHLGGAFRQVDGIQSRDTKAHEDQLVKDEGKAYRIKGRQVRLMEVLS